MTTDSRNQGNTRRDFLKTAAMAAASTSIMLGFPFVLRGAAPDRKFKVGLIGAGWYGKSDLCRLMQVAPVEVVSLCDPDKQMLAGAVEIAATAEIEGDAAHLWRLPRDAQGKGSRHRAHWLARPLARVAGHRRH